ncbi:unnamed protein product [Calypogeia fissa]
MGGKGPPRPSSSESDDWGDESWIVDCPCGVTYDDGEEMVECDECGVWVHTACCRVPKGLPTYVCDKCKIKKKLKESEESEVAQLLADLPSKPVSFEQERNHHEKPEAYITGHQNSSEIPIEERVHVHGIPGGDPSFFVGAPEVCSRQLWKYTGYVPKLLKLEYKELPDPQDDVVELLRNLKVYREFDVPMFEDVNRKFAPLALENVKATVAPMAVDTSNSREEDVKKVEVQFNEGTPMDRQGKSVRKGEGKVDKHKHKTKVKEEKPHHHRKRVRDECGLKEQSSKKKPRSNGDVLKPEDGGDSKKLDVAAAQEIGALKSPLSSPKNPKAMKKLAVQEFMDGDVITCSVCGKVEPHMDTPTGGSTGGGSDSLCQECEKVRRRSAPLSPKQETGSVKQEPAVVSGGNSDGTLEVKAVSKRELDYCEAGTGATRSRAEGNQASPDGNRQENLLKNKVCNDSPTEAKKVDVDLTNLHKNTAVHENLKGRDEKRRWSVKVEPNCLTTNHVPVDSKIAEIPEALELPAERTVVAAKSPGESAARAEDLRQDGAHVVASRPSSADDAETRTAGDSSNAVCGNKQAVSVEEPLPVSLPANSSKPVQLLPESSTVPVLHGSPGSVPAEPENGNGSSVTTPQDRVVPPVLAEMMEDKTIKFSASTLSTETKSQGSARTAGHLPASFRGKTHGERCNPHLQRLISGAGAQQHASSQAGQSLVQFSVCGVPRSVHNSVAMAPTSIKGSSGDDAVLGKQHGQPQADPISPVQQASKQTQPSRLHTGPPTAAQKSPAGLSEASSPSQPSSALRIESDQQLLTKGQQGVLDPSRNESSVQAASPKEPKIATGFNSETQVSKPIPSAQVTPAICQQARQLNGIGHVYVSRKHRENHTSKDPSGTLTSQALNSSVSNTKISVSALKSPSSGTSSSSPTSPLVTTPSSKSQPSVKVPESLPSQKSLSGGSTPNASASHSSSKFSGSLTSNVSNSKQAGTLHSSKSTPSLPASPQSTKVASVSKQSARSNSLPVSKSGDGSNSMAKTPSGIVSSRGWNHSGSSSSAAAKENLKNSTHPSSKSASKASEKPAGAKPPSSGKSSHSLAPSKGSTLMKHQSGPRSNTLKASSTPSSAKHTTSHHSKSVSHKDEKSSMPSAPPVPKAMSTMPPPPQVSTKRSPPTVLTSSVATTLKDEELALLLHQELNSSPRVPRVPRVRQAGVSLQLVQPSLSSAKGPFASAASGGPSHKEHQMNPRKRSREDRHKDTSKEEGGRNGGKRSEEHKMDGEKVSTEKSGRNGSIDGFSNKERSGSAEGNARHHGFGKGNLSIIVPGNDEGQEGDKKSPAQSNVLTLPGLIDEVLSSRDHQLSYEDVCEAVLPHWPKLRKPNGERYAYPSHRLAVLDCLRNRPAWAHLVGRGPKTHPGRKRRRNEIKSLSDSDDEDDHLGLRDSDDLDTGKSIKRRKESDGDKRAGEASEDARKGGRQVRRRRRVEIEDGTDGEDEPVNVTKKASSVKPEVSKSDDGTSQEEEPDAESSPSSDDEASNYSTDDEEMVVHRGIRNRRRPTDESSSSDDDID